MARQEQRGVDIKSLGASVIGLGSRNTELAIRIAVFTAVAHSCLALLFVAGYQVYIILETFVRPLMWALLTGTFLFPFKSFLADLVKSWLNGLKTTKTPILIGIALTPVKLVDKSLDFIGAEIVDFFRQQGWKIIYTVAGIIAYFVLYFYCAPYLGFLGFILKHSLRVTSTLSTHVIWLIIIPYAAALHIFWTQGYRKHLIYAAIPLWILIGFYGYYLLDDLAVPVYLFVVITIALGYTAKRDTIPRKSLSDIRSEDDIAALGSRSSRSGTQSQIGVGTRSSIRYRKLDGTDKEIPQKQTATVVQQEVVTTESTTSVVDDDTVQPQFDNGPGVLSRLGTDVREISRFMLQNTYQNVAEALKEDSLATDTAKADAEQLRNKLKELGMGTEDEPMSGTWYLRLVFWAFLILQAITTYYVIPLLLLPVSYRILKLLARRQNVMGQLKSAAAPLLEQVKAWTCDRSEVVSPSVIKQLITYAKIGDRKVLSIIEGVTDETVSAILICLMFLIALIGSVIAMLQIENETSYMVRVSGSGFDNLLESHPEFYEWLPEAEDFQHHLQNAMESAYVYGRDWAIKTIRSTIADSNQTRIAEIERDLTVIADRFYNYYVAKNITDDLILQDTSSGLGSVIGFKIGDPLLWFSGNQSGNATSIWDIDIFSALNTDALEKFNKYLDFSNLQAFAKNHIETFVSVLESIWLILRSNIALILSLGTTVASVTLTYFSAFLNFILCAVIYLTTLFYLLSSSGNRYKPIELILAASRYYPGAEKFADIVENAVSGIFAVSIKIGTFYGFYTWVLLSFCGVHVRFIPSILAALFAVCPLVPSYVVCLPAAVALWFRSDYVTMVILGVGAYLPKLFVDAAIYGDLKTTNPYIFGLSVAGGLVTLGIEGAVIGPLMLCFFVIVMECYKLTIQSKFLGNDEAEREEETVPLSRSGSTLQRKEVVADI